MAGWRTGQVRVPDDAVSCLLFNLTTALDWLGDAGWCNPPIGCATTYNAGQAQNGIKPGIVVHKAFIISLASHRVGVVMKSKIEVAFEEQII